MRRLICYLPWFIALALTGCESGGHFTFLGYTSRPNYDTCIKTVYVPIFENKTFVRGLEFDLTRAVIQTIETKTPFKVTHDCDKADTQLTGTILTFNKNILNRNQLNEQRETETVLTVGVVWKDLRSGEILSLPKAAAAAGPPFGGPDVPPQQLPPGVLPPKPQQVLVTSTASYIPEVGQSNTTAKLINCNRLATRIVELMERPW